MPLVKVKEIYQRARQEGYGVSGFCAENLDMILAILKAAEEAFAPVIVVLWEADIRSAGPGYLEAIVQYGAAHSRAPAAFMLDHGPDKAFCLQCMLNGHSGVMIDASHETLEGNIRTTREVCEMAHAVDVLVEGELGTVRRSFEDTGPFAGETIYTDPAEVPAFIRQTGVDALAISIGTESGIPREEPVLDIPRLRSIASCTDAYLVLHGGSGISGEMLSQAVRHGVTAFRFASEIRLAYLSALVKAHQSLPIDFPDTRHIYEPARAAAKEAVLERIEQLGCAGKAW